MSVLFVLIVASLLVAGGFLIAFLWAARSGQFDDSHTPAMRILLDDPASSASKKPGKEKTEKISKNSRKPD